MRNKVTGVTLVELMVVIVVIGILAAVAVPSYRSYAIRAQRAEAQTLVTRIAAAQERYYLSNNTYCPNANFMDPMPQGLGMPHMSDSGRYRVRVEEADAAGFIVSATAQSNMATDDPECRFFTYDDRGVKYGGPGPIRNPSTNNPKCWGN